MDTGAYERGKWGKEMIEQKRFSELSVDEFLDIHEELLDFLEKRFKSPLDAMLFLREEWLAMRIASEQNTNKIRHSESVLFRKTEKPIIH
jgi:hypothetical protein